MLRHCLGGRRKALAAGTAIPVYSILADAFVAIVRATIMGGLVLLANRLVSQTDGMGSRLLSISFGTFAMSVNLGSGSCSRCQM